MPHKLLSIQLKKLGKTKSLKHILLSPACSMCESSGNITRRR